MSKGEQIEKLRTGPLSSFLLEPLLLAVEALEILQCKIDNCNINLLNLRNKKRVRITYYSSLVFVPMILQHVTHWLIPLKNIISCA